MNTATMIELLGCIALLAAVPILVQGFRRRATGKTYESTFSIQRAPQLAALANGLLILGVFYLFPTGPLDLSAYLPSATTRLIAWLGVLLYLSGLIFILGGYYSLGANFSPDAELLRSQTLTSRGFYRVVMHPAYSGFVQALIGAGLASGSLAAVTFTVAIVAPLWLRRARYEEGLLLRAFGDEYKTYAASVGWRRLVPRPVPFGP